MIDDDLPMPQFAGGLQKWFSTYNGPLVTVTGMVAGVKKSVDIGAREDGTHVDNKAIDAFAKTTDDGNVYVVFVNQAGGK